MATKKDSVTDNSTGSNSSETETVGEETILMAPTKSGRIPSSSKTPSKAGAGRGFINPPIPKDAKYAKGGMTASRRADGIAQRGKTRGKMR
jgi:hypothetical protein